MIEQNLEELAEYNSRLSKGIVHTKEFIDRMNKLQSEFDEEQNILGEQAQEEFDYTHR